MKNQIEELREAAELLADRMSIPLADAMLIICSIHQTKVIEKHIKRLEEGLEKILETHKSTLLN